MFQATVYQSGFRRAQDVFRTEDAAAEWAQAEVVARRRKAAESPYYRASEDYYHSTVREVFECEVGGHYVLEDDLADDGRDRQTYAGLSAGPTCCYDCRDKSRH